METRKNSNKPKLCSIEYLHHDSPFEEMLLNSEPRNPVIQEEDEDQLFDLYITPYHIRPPDDHLQRDTVSEDTTIHNFSKKDEISTQYRKNEEEKQLTKLKRIIDKKNKIIAELTEEIRALNKEMHGSILNENSRYEKRSANKKAKDNRQREPKQDQFTQDLRFLQRNNTELFEELNKCRKERNQYLQKLEDIRNKIVPQLQQQLILLQKQNAELKKHNKLLLQEAKQYIKQGRKQVKYMSKMRQILAQKTGIKDLHVNIGFIQSRDKYQHLLAAHLSEQMPREKKKQRNKIYSQQRFSRSQRKNVPKQNRLERCFSNGNMSRFKQ